MIMNISYDLYLIEHFAFSSVEVYVEDTIFSTPMW